MGRADQVMGFLHGCNEAARFMLNCCCGPISTETGMKGRWTVQMGDLQYVILYHKERISNKKKHHGRYCDAEGATVKIKMLICGKDIGALKCQGLIAFTAVATQEC